MKYKNKLINKALKHYGYLSEINFSLENEKFYQHYLSVMKCFKKNKMDFKVFYFQLMGAPYINHIAAKNLMYQGKLLEAGKYLARTAYWGIASRKNAVPAEYIDFYSNYLNYALFIEEHHSLELGLSMLAQEWEKPDGQTKVYRTQPIYPKTYFLHFLLGKWKGENPLLMRLFTDFSYQRGYGIYQQIVDNWLDLSVLPESYWDSLCDYHLEGLSLYSGDNWFKEEFLLEGIIPMELLNLIKVRRKLGLSTPEFKHELFSLPTSRFPELPTGYKPELDVLFQLVKLSAENQRIYTLEEVIMLLKAEYGDDVAYFL